MSYFPIDITTMNEERIMIQKTHEEPKKRSPHNVPHSPEAKKKISETQQARYEMIRQLVRKGQQKQMTEERVRDICHEVLNEYLDRNAKPINNRPMNINL
jgi:hypothetical protein